MTGLPSALLASFSGAKYWTPVIDPNFLPLDVFGSLSIVSNSTIHTPNNSRCRHGITLCNILQVLRHCMPTAGMTPAIDSMLLVPLAGVWFVRLQLCDTATKEPSACGTGTIVTGTILPGVRRRASCRCPSTRPQVRALRNPMVTSDRNGSDCRGYCFCCLMGYGLEIVDS